jgi:hypothetical protein
MTPNNANVFLSSMARTDKRFKYYGTGSIENISLLKMIYKYACYSEDYATLQTLDRMVSLLQQIDPDICVNVQNSVGSGFFPEDNPDVTIPDTSNNTAPTITVGSVTVGADDNTYSVFVIGDFTNSFADVDGDGIGDVIIKTLPANGTLTYNLINVTINQVIPKESIGSLVYTRNSTLGYSTNFNYAVYDDNQNPLQSNTVQMAIEVIAASNQPATIGDNTIYSDNREVTILTLAMFTSGLTAPYSDPESDLIDAIRIDDISSTNVGVFKLDGAPISEGDIITREQLSANSFTHEGPDQATISSDVFGFSARDEGSQIWVQ